MAPTFTPYNPWKDDSTSVHDDYEQARNLLIYRSAGLALLVKNLKELHGLTNLSNKKLMRIFYEARFNNPKLSQEIEKICEKLEISDYVLLDMIINNFKEEHVPQKSLPVYFLFESSVLPKGNYIRIEDHTRLETVVRSFKFIKTGLDMIKNQDLPLDKRVKRAQRVRAEKRDTLIRDLEKKVRLYNMIEKSIKDQLNADVGLPEDNRVNLKETFKFVSEENPDFGSPKQIENVYRDLLSYYKIPPLRDFKKLLISPI